MTYAPENNLLTLMDLRASDLAGSPISARSKKKTLEKFGRNTAVGTSEVTVKTLYGSEVHETFVSTNAIDSIASLNSSDQSITIYYEGHTVSGGNFTFVTGSVATDASDGQTRVALPTPVARISRSYMDMPSGTAANAGAILFFQNGAVSGGSVSTPANVHMTIPAGRKQSYKAATTFSSTDYAYIIGAWASLLKAGGASAYVDVQLEIRLQGEIFLPRPPFSVNRENSFVYRPYPTGILVPPNADVRMVAAGSTTGLDVSAGFDAILAKA